MADNTEVNSGTGIPVATDAVTYSGDADQHVQLVRPVLVSGSEGAKTVVELPGDATNGLDVDVTRLPYAAHDAAVSGAPVLVGLEAKDFDGSALPNVVSAEADAVRAAGSLSGVAYVMMVNEDGSAVGSMNAVQSGTWNITNISGTVSLPTGAATAAKQPALGTAGTPSTDVLTVQGHASMTALKVDGSGVTQPISVAGTVAVSNAGLTALNGAISGSEVQVDVLTLPNVTIGAAVPAGTNNIGDVDVASIAAGDNAIGRVKLTDGTDVADILDLSNSNPLTVAIVDGSGSQITSFGGGTQYTEADTDSSITGTAMLWEDTSDTLRAVSAAKPLPVNIISGAGSGGTAIADGAAFTADTTNLTPIGGYRDDASSATVTEGDAAACRITENRALHVNLRDATGAELSVGGGTQYDEDTAHSSGDKVTMAGVVRADTAASLSGTDGDRSCLIVDSSGRLHANVGVVVPGTAATNLGKAVDAVAGGTDTGVALLGVRTDTPATITPANGDYAHARLDSQGKLYTNDPTCSAALGLIYTDTQFLAGMVHAEDEASTNAQQGVAMLAVRKATPANTSGTDGDFEFPQMSAGRLWTSATIDAALPAGTNAIGKLAANSGVDIGDVDVTSLPAIPAGNNNIGDVDVASIAAGSALIGDVGLQGRTSGGLSIFRTLDLDESEEEIKGTAGQIYWIHAINLHTAPLYLKFYNATAANVTVGSTTPVLTLPVPSAGTANGAGFQVNLPMGLAFGTAISAAATTGLADADTGAPSANLLVLNVGYK